MKKLYHRLEKRRTALLEQYDEEDLHQLRVTLRRMRSQLKGSRQENLRKLRKDLGHLAETTNAARDWDTLAVHAQALLTPGQFSSLVPWLRQHQQLAHEQVRALLESDEWSDTIAHWKKHTPADQGPVADSDAAFEEFITGTLQRVAEAREKALEYETDHDWHTLRIAIKELRYRLDEQPEEARSRQTRQALAICKQLQEELGTWHDTVVHRELLAGATGDAGPIQAVFDKKLARKGEECLDRVRAMLMERGVERALSPAPR
jgi:CHAD domain-containing protein